MGFVTPSCSLLLIQLFVLSTNLSVWSNGNNYDTARRTAYRGIENLAEARRSPSGWQEYPSFWRQVLAPKVVLRDRIKACIE